MKKLDNSTFQHISGNKTYLHHVTQLDISSTMIRKNVKAGKTIKYIVPENVKRIINEKGLYRA